MRITNGASILLPVTGFAVMTWTLLSSGSGTPLPFTFRYEFLCGSDDDCLNGFRCDVASGMCLNECPDADDDGHTTCAGDCDDGNAAVHPGRSEVCGNSLDDDCDGTVNEGCGGGGGKIHFEQQA